MKYNDNMLLHEQMSLENKNFSDLTTRVNYWYIEKDITKEEFEKQMLILTEILHKNILKKI